MKDDWTGLRKNLELKGYQARIVPLRRLEDLRGMIETRHAQALFDEELYREQLSAFSFHPPADLPSPSSLIIVAVPAPQHRAIFTWDGRPFPALLPPTYVRYRADEKHPGRDRLSRPLIGAQSGSGPGLTES